MIRVGIGVNPSVWADAGGEVDVLDDAEAGFGNGMCWRQRKGNHYTIQSTTQQRSEDNARVGRTGHETDDILEDGPARGKLQHWPSGTDQMARAAMH